MCDLCRADENYFHTAECVYDQLVSEYPVMWLRDSTRIGACYTLRELLSPEGMVLAIQNSLPMKGWRLRMRYNEAIDEEINPQHGDCIELPSRADALQAFVGSGSLPQLLKTDNGSEFAGKMLDKWVYERGIRIDFSRPGTPTDNATVESFNGRLRQECLNENWFMSLEDARCKIEAWRIHYNQRRPHSALDWMTPSEFAEKSVGCKNIQPT